MAKLSDLVYETYKEKPLTAASAGWNDGLWFRFSVQLYAFWWIWHNKTVTMNMAASDNPVSVFLLVLNVIVVTGMATQVTMEGRASDDRFAAFYLGGMAVNFLELVHIVVANRMWLGGQGKKICAYLVVMAASRGIEATIWGLSFGESVDEHVPYYWLGAACFVLLVRGVGITMNKVTLRTTRGCPPLTYSR